MSIGTSLADESAGANAATTAFGHRVADAVSAADLDRTSANASALSRWEARRHLSVRLAITLVAIGVFAALVECISAAAALGGLLPYAAASTVFIASIIGYVPYHIACRGAWIETMGVLCERFDVSYRRTPRDRSQFKPFYTLNLFSPSGLTDLVDCFQGTRRSTSFEFCQAAGAGYDRRSERFVRVNLLRISTPRRRYATTVVLHKGTRLNNDQCPPGLRPVGLEDPRFNNEFAVYGSDQVEAREILTPVFMERLFSLAAAFDAGKLRCAFCGSDFLVALDVRQRPSGPMRLTDPAFMEAAARKLQSMLAMVDFFAEASV